MNTNSMLYNTIVRLIELGQTSDLIQKIDVFYAVGSLSLDEYQNLRDML